MEAGALRGAAPTVRPARRDRLVAFAERFLASRWSPYAIAGTIALAAAQTWFAVGTVLAGGDNPPPIAPDASYRSLWNDFSSGAGGVARDIVLLPYYEGIRYLGPEAFQRIWLSASVAGCAVAVVYFTRGLGLTPVAAGLAGLFGALNPYFLTNKLFLAPRPTLIAAALLGGIVLRVAGNGVTARRVLAFALVSLLASVIFVNPPGVYLLGIALVVTVAAALARFGRVAVSRLGRFALLVPVPVVLVNLWWIVPAWLSLHGSDARPVSAAGPLAWEWVVRRASLGNVLGLSTTWAWPQYFPFAGTLDRFPFSILHYALPLLALVGVVLVRRSLRRTFIVLLAAAAALAWITKGLHTPARGASLWLYDHVPALWLLRDPEKTLVILALLFAVFAGYGASRLAQSPRFKGIGFWAALVLVVGAFAYVFPLYTGFRGSTHTRVPAYYAQMKRVLAAAPVRGKVMVLPLPDYYQVPYTWNYYGITIWRFTLGRAIADTNGGSYQTAAPAATQLSREVQTSLLDDGGRGTAAQLRSLGVSYVMVSGDVNPSVAGRHLVRPALLRRLLERAPGIHFFARRGPLSLYAVERPVGDVYAAMPVGYRGPRWLVPSALAATDLPHVPALLARMPPATETRTIELQAPREQRAVRIDRVRNTLTATFMPAPGERANVRPVSLSLPRADSLVTVDGRPLPMPQGRSTVRVSPAAAVPIDVFRAIGPPRTAEQEAARGACRGIAERLSVGGALTTGGAGACTVFVSPLQQRGYLRLVVRARSSAARMFTICFVPGEKDCTHAAGSGVDRVLVAPPNRATLAVLVDGSGAGLHATVRRYRRVADAELHRPSLVVTASTAVPTGISSPTARPDACPSLEGISEQARQARSTEPDTLELPVGKRPSCFSLTPVPVVDGARYRVTFAQRSPRRYAIHLCVWEYGVGRCVPLTSPKGSRGWRQYEIVFEPRPGATALQLVAYTTGGRTPSVAEVRAPRIAPAQPGVSLTLPAGAAPPPLVVRRSGSSTSLHVRIVRARSPYVLVLPQTFARGWKLDTPWHGAQPRHVRVDEWANGWLISNRGSYDLRLRYTPARYADAAKTLDLVAVPLLFLMWIALVLRSTAQRRRER